MHTHAVHRLARAARSQGIGTLRFQFRGVGLSSGVHDGGRGEQQDVRAALAWLAERAPALPRFVAGFSFGAWMAVAVGCADAAVRGVLAAGLPVRLYDLAAAQACAKPLAAVQAAEDAFGTPAEVEALLGLPAQAGPRRVAAVEGASHLFTEDLPGLERESGAAFGWLLGEARA
jgi:alpha/beta superfamily hydrolase